MSAGDDWDYRDDLDEILAAAADNLRMDGAQSIAQGVEMARDRLRELEAAMVARDGGTHDADCKIHRGKLCSCGHDFVRFMMGPKYP